MMIIIVVLVNREMKKKLKYIHIHIIDHCLSSSSSNHESNLMDFFFVRLEFIFRKLCYVPILFWFYCFFLYHHHRCLFVVDYHYWHVFYLLFLEMIEMMTMKKFFQFVCLFVEWNLYFSFLKFYSMMIKYKQLRNWLINYFASNKNILYCCYIACHQDQ